VTARSAISPSASTERAAVVGAAGIAVAALVSPDVIQNGPVLCPFRRVTGLPCPACGLTRSWVQFAHLNVDDAFAAHPFGPVTFLVVAALVVAVVLRRVRGHAALDLSRIARHPATLAMAAIWIVVAVARMIDTA